MSNPSHELVVVTNEVEIANLATPEQTISLLRKENAKLTEAIESQRSIAGEMANVIIESMIRPTGNALNYLAAQKVLGAFRRRNPFWKSRAQEMAEANQPDEKLYIHEN